MKRTTTSLLATLAAGGCLALAIPASPASAANITIRVTGRASALAGEVEATTKGTSWYPTISGNGRYIAFTSGARLVPEDKDSVNDVYVKDLLTDGLERIDVTTDGKPATGGALAGDMTPDGRYVVFSSAASNLVAGVGNGKSQIFVRDRKAKTTEVVSVSATEVLGNGNSPVDYDYRMRISSDARYVAFSSLASNLGPDANVTADVFVRDRQAGTTALISVADGGAKTDAGSIAPDMSADGRYVAFTSYATNLVTGDTNGSIDVFRRDRQTTTTIRVSLKDDDTQSPTGGYAGVMDDSGDKVLFVSDSKLNAIDPNSTSDVFQRTVSTTSTTVASTNKDGWAAGESIDPEISGDGKTVVWSSPLGVADGITNATDHLYLRSNGGSPSRQSVRTDGFIVAGNSMQPRLSTNGQVLAFTSDSNKLVTNDSGEKDVFFRRWAGIGPFTTSQGFAQRQNFDFAGSAVGPAVTAATAAVDNGASPEHWVASLAYAPAFAGKQPPAIRLYTAYFNRLPDKSGLAFWVKKLDAGTKLDQVSAKFAASSEFKTKYGNTTNTQFVNLVYANVLQRSPDAAGLSFWVNKLDGGMSRGTVMTNFSESSEGKRFMQPQVSTTLLGLGMLHKIPTGTLLTNMVAGAKADGPEGAAQVIFGSAEYKDGGRLTGPPTHRPPRRSPHHRHRGAGSGAGRPRRRALCCDAPMDAPLDLPPMPNRAVTDDEVEAFWRDGVVHLPGILPLAWVEALEAPVERVLARARRPTSVASPRMPRPAPTFAGGVDHWRHDATFEAFALASPLGPIVATLLRSEPRGLGGQRPREGGRLTVPHPVPHRPGVLPPHRPPGVHDLGPAGPRRARSGMVCWVAGSHLDGVDYRPNMFVVDDPIPGTEGTVVPDVHADPALAERLITFDVQPGDITVHHARTIHGAPANGSDRRRRAVSVRYVGDDARYLHKPGLPGRPGLDLVADGDPIGPPWCPPAWPR
ncbi:MAG: DUF4214 domain-containing protein [Acidimicrobiales bacterium]